MIDISPKFPTAPAGEIGDHIEQFNTPGALQCYAGTAPVTRRSGRSEFVVARRLAHNRYLIAALLRTPGNRAGDLA